MRVLLVDASDPRRRQLAEHLRRESCEVQEADQAPAAYDADVALLAFDGPLGLVQVARLRDAGRARVLAIVPDPLRIDTFEAGADDVVSSSSLSLREVGLRLRALHTRRARTPGPPPSRIVPSEELRLDVDERRATIHGRALDLSERELALLEALASRPGVVIDREALLRRVWEGEDLHPRTVDSAVKRLRARLGELGAGIETVRGVGYRWRADGNG